jgi:hypothetical protein
VRAAFARVRNGLAQVGVSGTATGLTARYRAALGPGLSVLAKTGTLNEATDRFKALAFTLGSPEEAGSAPVLSCGVSVAMYFEFGDNYLNGAGRGVLSPVHLQFATGPLAEVLARHWAALQVCPPSPALVGPTVKRAGR